MVSKLGRAMRSPLFLAVVAAPTILAAAYYGYFATGVYVSESKFVLRNSERQPSLGLGALFRGSGLTTSQDDAWTVQEYVLSRDALEALNSKLYLEAQFSAADVDLLSRYPGLFARSSREELYQYYRKKVTVHVDGPSSIVTLTTRGFSRESAAAMNRMLLELSEALVNRLNERAQRDLVRMSLAQVAQAQAQVADAGLALARYRNSAGVLDPEKQSALPLQQIAKLKEEYATSKATALQLANLAPDNPQLAPLQQRIQFLESEIAVESARVAGGGRNSLAGQATEYHRLLLEKEFSEKLLASSMNSLEQARQEAHRQQLYLERIAQPNVPDEAVEPRRARNVIAALILSLLIWGILTLLVAGVKEHRA